MKSIMISLILLVSGCAISHEPPRDGGLCLTQQPCWCVINYGPYGPIDAVCYQSLEECRLLENDASSVCSFYH